MKKELSLQSLIRFYWLGMLLVFAAVYGVAWSYMLRMLTARAEESIQKSVRIVQSDIEDSLEIVDSFLYESLYSGAKQAPRKLYDSLRNETDPVKLLETQNTVLASAQSVVSWSGMIDFVMVYTGRDDFPWLETGSADNYQARRELKVVFEEMITNDEKGLSGKDAVPAALNWYMVCVCAEGTYMLRLLKIEDSYLLVCVSEQKILQMLKGAAFEEDGIACIAAQDGRIIASSEQADVTLVPEREGTYISVGGVRYLQTGYVSERSGYYFGILTEQADILADMNVFRGVFLVVFLLLMLVMPLLFALMQHSVGRPVRSIADTMDQIAAGDLDVVVRERPRIRELGQLVRAFNHMTGRIRQLKIEKYEGELEVQRATMQYLQLQIKPHFYANMFNIVYSLAQRRDFELIQKVSTAVVRYSRYMFHDAAELVELKRELTHVRDYMEIQEIRYVRQISCRVDVPEALDDALIPPFLIQSHVENSVKYAFSSQKDCRIRIAAETDSKRENVTLVIRDNGTGYPEELLASDWKHEGEEGHIGLTNVCRRLRLIYGEKADIRLFNERGAVTMIRIPYIAMDGMTEEE